MTFLNPLDVLIPKLPFSFSSEIWVWVTSGAGGGVGSGWILGTCHLSILVVVLVVGRSGQGALLNPHIENPPTPVLGAVEKRGNGSNMPVFHWAQLCGNGLKLLRQSH